MISYDPVSYTHLDVYKRQRENVLRAGQEKIKLCTAKMTGSANYSIKQVELAEEEVQQVLSTETLPIASVNG